MQFHTHNILPVCKQNCKLRILHKQWSAALDSKDTNQYTFLTIDKKYATLTKGKRKEEAVTGK